jgi:hypothetical protein
LGEYFNSSYTGPFLRLLDEEGGRKPLWMSECGYSTMDRSEEDQANYIARAVPYFFADPASDDRFSLFTYYELKDLPVGSAMIGDEHNYHFGLCRSDRSKKLAFYTYRMLVALLQGRVVRAAAAQVATAATEGEFGELHHHLLQREDGTQILFIYDRENAATAEAALMAAGSTCAQWELDGRSRPWPHFNGTTISNIVLTPGQVRIYEIR